MANGNEPISAGNLAAVVERLTGGGSGSLADLLYPVGAIYLSTSSTSPQTLFGGTWTRIQDRFLLCAGSTYAAGKTGGEAEHTLTVSEMPSHTHTARMSANRFATQNVGNIAYIPGTGSSVDMTAAGGNAAHNNMPPYLSVYAWRRTA